LFISVACPSVFDTQGPGIFIICYKNITYLTVWVWKQLSHNFYEKYAAQTTIL